MKEITSFDAIADTYDKTTGDSGDLTHQNTIDPALFTAIGNIDNKVIYDIGCGNGYIARKLIMKGAKEVYASDISEKLINIAQTKYPDLGVNYMVKDGKDFTDIAENYFDLIIMNMSIHYFEDLDTLLYGIAKSLKPGGQFIFTTWHPFRRLGLLDAGAMEPDIDKIMEYIKPYREFRKVVKNNIWTGNKDLAIYFAPISLYIEKLASQNLLIDKFVEPKSIAPIDDVNDHTLVETEIPMFYAMRAKKII